MGSEGMFSSSSMLARPGIPVVKSQLQSREGSQSQGRQRPVIVAENTDLPYRMLLQPPRPNPYSPKQRIDADTTLSRLNKRLSSYETDISVRLMSGKHRRI